MTTNVGMIGLGIMGSAMSSNLLADGFVVAGCDIDQRRLDSNVQAVAHLGSGGT